MDISLQENPFKPGTYRVVLHTGDSSSFEDFLQFTDRSTTISRADAIAVLTVAAEWITARAKQGREVNLGPLGRSRLGMKGSFDSMPQRVEDSDVQLTISWILPGKMRRQVAGAGGQLVRQRIAPRPKAPMVLDVRPLLDNAMPAKVLDRYVADGALRIYGARLDYDNEREDEGVFLIDEQNNAARVQRVFLNSPSKLLVLMPADAAGNYRLEVRRRHPAKTGRLLTGRYSKVLEPEQPEPEA